jgi:hypothetical protein
LFAGFLGRRINYSFSLGGKALVQGLAQSAIL